MKKSLIISAIISIGVLMFFSACDPEAKYEIENVKINLSLKRHSIGYAEMEYTTNKLCYYYTNILPETSEYTNLMKNNPKQFMSLMIDSAYVEYVNWRYNFLKKGEAHVADFSSHSLYYGNNNLFFQKLKENTKYNIYAFAVDPMTNKPVGELFIKEVTTLSKQAVKVHFNSRVKGNWIYIYPLDDKEKIVDYSPYAWTYMDEEAYGRLFNYDPMKLIKYMIYLKFDNDESGTAAGVTEAGESSQSDNGTESGEYDLTDYYTQMGIDMDNDNNAQILEEGKYFYIVIASLDGGINNAFHYRVLYEGEKTNVELIYGRDNVE